MARSLRSLILAAIFICAQSITASAQIVQSFCDGPASLQSKYVEDAWYVAYYYQLKSDSLAMHQSVPISVMVKDSILRAILGIYNTNLPARDSVVDLYNIHEHKKIDLHTIELFVDTAHAWVRNLLTGPAENTGNPYFDTLATAYNLSVGSINYYPDWVTQYDAYVKISTTKYVNTAYLSTILLGQSGVVSANPAPFGGDGNRIFYTREDSSCLVTFRRAWEDCPHGCHFQHDWLFRVYDNCKVEFVSSYGDPLNSTPVQDLQLVQKTRISPNPAIDRIFIAVTGLRGAQVQVQITDTRGQLISEYILPIGSDGQLQSEIRIENLVNGLYFVNLRNENGLVTKKIVVNR